MACAYLLCELFDFSGAIASVVCGVLYSNMIYEARKKRGKEWDLEEYKMFWDVVDNLFNSILYVMLGLSFVNILGMPHVVLLSCAAIIANLLGRAGSLAASSVVMGPIPDGFTRSGFITIFTWGGLRGGLCIALAMSASSMLSADVYAIVLGCTYAIVFFTTVVQGLTMSSVYRQVEKRMRRI